MNLPSSFFKFSPYEFVPITKTPWGGSQISKIKKKYLSDVTQVIPERIGEAIKARIGDFLLKWIDANEPLSIQIHPDDSNPMLQPHECGKTEAWFVQNLFNPTPVYLGFKEGYSQEEIKQCLQSNDPTNCLHSFIPNKNDYIAIPTGCIHALGADILVAEPQIVLPNKEGKTWRVFDWNRLYNHEGQRDPTGVPRELHIQQLLTAIDWSLPRGQELEKILIKNLKHGETFLGNKYNPFCLSFFEQECTLNFESPVKNQFSIMTVFSGEVEVSNTQQTLQLVGGETAFIPQENCTYEINIRKKFIEDSPCVLIFTLQ